MTGDLSKVVGSEMPAKPVSWNQRDLLTYACGVGAKADDLTLVYELDKSFAAIPTYPVVLALKGDSQDVNRFADNLGGWQAIPGMPRLDPNKVVHASQSIQILKDLPPASGPGWTWTTKYTGVAEIKNGIVLTAENNLLDPKGVVYAKLYISFILGAEVSGNKFSKVIAGPPQGKPIPKDRQADWTITDKTSPEQALLFRLSGDYNPLHIDPSIGNMAGFGGVILHGLSTFGFAARGLIKTIGNNDPRVLKLFGARFTAPVKPGDALETQVWEVGPGPAGSIEVAFITQNLTSGKIALGGGIAYIQKGAQAKL
ncbi:peroxisomal dehydratase [Mycena crocata]|nr:peroxisomal dehydratase [Mycena crocata]